MAWGQNLLTRPATSIWFISLLITCSTLMVVTTIIEVYMLGFNCILSNPHKKRQFDGDTRDTMLSVFEEFMGQNPDDACIFVCDNLDGRARNRRIIFGRRFNDSGAGTTYERHHSTIKYNNNPLYSSLIIRIDNPDKAEFIKANRYTIKKTMGGGNDEE